MKTRTLASLTTIALMTTVLLTGCGGEFGDEGGSSSSSGVSSASVTGTWINSRGTASWSFNGDKSSGSGHFKRPSTDGKTCEDMYIKYFDVNYSTGTFSYYATRIVWTGASPADSGAMQSKTYTSRISISGNSAVIEGESFTRGTREAC